MLRYQKEMTSGATSDSRGIARLMYALGRRNSLEECWALSQYWRGSWVGIFEPQLTYDYDDDFPEKNYGFLYDNPTTLGYKATEEIYRKEVKDALAMLRSDEVRAQAEYILGNVATVIKRYGNTPTAARIRTSCDNWHSWL